MGPDRYYKKCPLHTGVCSIKVPDRKVIIEESIKTTFGAKQLQLRCHSTEGKRHNLVAFFFSVEIKVNVP